MKNSRTFQELLKTYATVFKDYKFMKHTELHTVFKDYKFMKHTELHIKI